MCMSRYRRKLKVLFSARQETNNVSLITGKSNTSQVVHQAGAYPGFCSMKRLGVFLLPPGWDASPSQGYSKH